MEEERGWWGKEKGRERGHREWVGWQEKGVYSSIGVCVCGGGDPHNGLTDRSTLTTPFKQNHAAVASSPLAVDFACEMCKHRAVRGIVW